MTFFLNCSTFLWYILITLTLTHLILLIDRYIAKYEINCSDILLSPLAAEYRGSVFLKSLKIKNCV